MLYRRDASEAWHEIAHTVYAGSTWKHGRLIVDNLLPGEYTFAAWDKEALGEEEHYVPEKRMHVYPNPAEGRINVSWEEATDGQIRIVSPEGKELESVNFNQVDHICLFTDGLPKGCCTVLRFDKDGKLLNVEKLIIK